MKKALIIFCAIYFVLIALSIIGAICFESNAAKIAVIVVSWVLINVASVIQTVRLNALKRYR